MSGCTAGSATGCPAGTACVPGQPSGGAKPPGCGGTAVAARLTAPPPPLPAVASQGVSLEGDSGDWGVWASACSTILEDR